MALDFDVDDARVAGVLCRAVQVIDPVLDGLARTDPFGLKERRRLPESSDGPFVRALDSVGWALNAADVPGTRAWDDKDLDGRVDWWVRRVGALNTVWVASPGVFGVVADRLLVQDVLGFANQAIVLCAVARECGIVDRRQQVRLLGAVLCDRELDDVGKDSDSDAAEEGATSFWTSLQHLAGLLRAIDAELDKRPHPRSFYRFLGMLPVVGAVAEYFGEYGALVRAAKKGRAWIGQHPAVIRAPEGTPR